MESSDHSEFWRSAEQLHWVDTSTPQRKKLLRYALTKYLSLSPSSKVQALDAGCGLGDFVKFFEEQSYEAYGADASLVAVSNAQLRCPSATIVRASLEHLPFADNRFDIVWCSEVLEHIVDVSGAFNELSRVTKPNGLLILTVPYHGFLKNLIITSARFDWHFSVDGPHLRFFTKRSLDICLRRAGFEPLAWNGVGRSWPMWKSFFVTARRAPGPLPGA
ncbi:MAG: class I SAM-dependent methyltransferase [Chloroflexi bacterium]|nr:class I SAM-dependent methyltransferase [Chloroflexota bacterium]